MPTGPASSGPVITGPVWGPAAGGPATSLIVLLHGVGADGADLIGLAPMLATALPRCFFSAPDAPEPCDMAPYGRQWFSLADRRPAALLQGARRAAPRLEAHIEAMQARLGLGPERTALLGFSQGTMMALFTALRLARPIAGVVGFSGALLGGELLADEIRAKPPILLVHGDADEVVPYAALGAAVEVLGRCGVPVRWTRRAGLAHSIDEAGLGEAAQFLAEVLKPADPGVLTSG